MVNDKIVLTFPDGTIRRYSADLIGDALFDAACFKVKGRPFNGDYDDLVDMLLSIAGEEDIKADVPDNIQDYL